MALSPTPVSNTVIGPLSSFPFSPGGVGYPGESFSNWSLTTGVVNGATPVTVTDGAVLATSVILFSLNTAGGTVGAIPHVETITPGTGYTWQGSASDTSTYNILRIG